MKIMNIVLLVASVVIFSVAVWLTHNLNKNYHIQNTTVETQYTTSVVKQATEVVNEIIYIKDPRTNICYAYYWGGAGNGGPALTVVPEEKIPASLIINVKLSEIEKKAE